MSESFEDQLSRVRQMATDVPGHRIETPPISMEIVRWDAPSLVPHNALHDARGIQQHFKFMSLR